MKMTEEEVLAYLSRIERGEVTLTSKSQPQNVFAGNVWYQSSDGWTLVVFNDCNEWDYLDHITSPEGAFCDYADFTASGGVLSYCPSPKIAWEAYGIPGYLKKRKRPWKGAPS